MPVTLQWIGPALAMAVLGASLAAIGRLGIAGRSVLAVIFAAATIVPVGPYALAPVMLSLAGPASAALLVLLMQGLGTMLLGQCAVFRPSLYFAAAIVLMGLVLYPGTLGWTSVDPFDWGYRGLTVPALMAILVAAGFIGKVIDLPCWIGLAALMHVIDAYGTTNLWPYLIDPVAVLIAAAWLAIEPMRLQTSNA